MRWEELTGDLFPEAVKEAEGVCLLPLSVVERHAHHLPMGTDTYIGRELCRRVDEIEPVVIFPDFIFTQILEARHVAGTISIDGDLLLPLLDNVCREIARNGLKKIVIVNAHGGNNALIRYFIQLQLELERDYAVYIANGRLTPEEEESFRGMWAPEASGHAGAGETSMIMVIRPDLVRSDALKPDNEGMARGRLDAVRDQGVETGIWWYADFPTHYSGDANVATAEKGEQLLAARAQALARAVRQIKQDEVTMQLQDEFFAAHEHDANG